MVKNFPGMWTFETLQQLMKLPKKYSERVLKIIGSATSHFQTVSPKEIKKLRKECAKSVLESHSLPEAKCRFLIIVNTNDKEKQELLKKIYNVNGFSFHNHSITDMFSL